MMRPLATLGNVNVDLILGPLAPWPVPGSEVLCPEEDLRVGGAAGNAALAWQAMGLPFQCVASTGSDPFGDWLRAGLGAAAARWTRSAGATTISVGVTHPGAERTFLTTRGHLPEFGWADVEAQLDWPALRGGTLLLCGCFLMDRLSADYDRLFTRAEAEGVAIALDTGWPLEGWTEAIRTRALDWVAHCRLVLLNEVEATSLTGLSDPEAAAEALARRMPEGAIAVVKLGPRGALAHRGGISWLTGAPAVAVKDTIGAGDVFNAAFLAALARDADLPAALAQAVATASRAVSTAPRCYIPEELSA